MTGMPSAEDSDKRSIEVVPPAATPAAVVEMLAVAVQAGQDLEGRAAELDERLGGPLARALAEGFRAKPGETRLCLAGQAGLPHLLAIGVDAKLGCEAERTRRVAGVAIRTAREQGLASVALALPAVADPVLPDVVQAASEGLCLGDWSYDALKSDPAEEKHPGPVAGVIFLATDHPFAGDAATRGRKIAEAQNFARTLVALPGNIATPTYLEARARELGQRHGLRVEAWGPERLREEGFGALLAVSAGSSVEPRFLILEHAGEGGPPTVLVGKGVTFDSGGISIKPASGMEDMKYDMAGAAAVLGTLRAVAELSLPRRVIGLIPATENLPSGTALKPGDVIRGLAGRSIEVVNTDAEGRLILSDALAFGARLGPSVMVDLATLTGACVVALGHHAVGLLSSDDDLAEALGRAGETSGERVWRLPLWREYRKQLDSDIADLKNVGGRSAGTITAGWFLREFAEDVPWAHLDIAGTAWADEARPYQPKGATGVGVRLLIEWLRAS